MKRPLTKIEKILLAVLVCLVCLAATDTDTLIMGRFIVSNDYDGGPTCSTASGDGSICVDGDVEMEDDLDVGDDAAIAGALTVTGATAMNGGITCDTNKFTVADTSGNTAIAGTLTVTGATALNGGLAMDTNKFTVADTSGNTATAGTLACTGDFAINTNKFNVTAASGNTAVAGTLGVTGDVAINTNKFNITAASGNTTVAGTLGVTGDATLSAGMTVASPAILHQVIRFCGNGPDGGTETFLSPVPFDDTEADFIDGGAGCDGEDDTTIGNADEPWPLLKDAAFKPVAAVCTAICTGATAANDAIVFKLYDDTVAVTGATCTTSALGGDATAAQCTWTDTTPATVAAGSLIAIGIDNTDDDCNDAGDDFSCLVYVTF